MRQFFIIFFILFLTFLLAEESEVSFKYGLIGKQIANQDSIFLVYENNHLQIGDELKINLEYQKGKYLYVLYLNTNDEFQLLFSSISQENPIDDDEIFTSLPWMEIEEKENKGTIYIISAIEQLSSLEKNLKNYKKAKGKNKTKFHKKILNDISNYNKGITDKYRGNQVKKLPKPIIGGVTFRNTSSFKANLPFMTEQKLSYECTGEKIAIAEIKLF